ncbi:unnamed protein product [Ectocarpus fasciculatus]
MGGLLKTAVLLGLLGAACIFVVEGQELTSTETVSKDKVIQVGFMNFKHDDQQEDKLKTALQSDTLLSADNVEVGELVCETLEDAKEAKALEFSLGAGQQTVIADLVSYTTASGTIFSDGEPRNIWTGTVRESEDFDGLPTSISMTWTGCSTQNFVVQMISPAKDGGADTVVSLPNPSSGENFLLATVHHTALDETDVEDDIGRRLQISDSVGEHTNLREGIQRSALHDESEVLTGRRLLAKEAERGIARARLEDPDIDAKDVDIRLLQEYRSASPEGQEAFHERGLRRLSEDNVVMPGGRVLSSETVIDVLVLYTEKAMLESTSGDGAGRTIAQMESDIATAYQGANNALSASGVDFSVRIVHMEQASFDESDSIVDDVRAIQKNEDVHKLRDEYGADLVQLIGYYLNTCGVGFTMGGPSSAFAPYGYSVVHTNCLSNFSHIHELGHNFGANHNKENVANSQLAYNFAYRNCDGVKPFRTIMAYSSGCPSTPRVDVFSNPDKTYANHIQGTEEENNARVLNEAMATVVNFRESTTPTPGNQITTSIYPEALKNKWMKRKGCFQDKKNDRVMHARTKMEAIPGKTIGMTRENCMAYCHNHAKNYKFFGVENGDECYCRNGSKYNRHGVSSKCSTKCTGDSTKTCGGTYAIEVFKIKHLNSDVEVYDSAPTPAPTPSPLVYQDLDYEGCYLDVLPDLGMAHEEILDFKSADPEACNKHCAALRYPFFALEFGFVCSCGNTKPDESRLAADSLCSTPCTSPKTNSTCGGKWHQAIFSVYGGDGDQ